MVTPARLSEMELVLLTTPADTEDAPWMVMPDFQWRVVALLLSILRFYAERAGVRRHLSAELKVTMPRALAPRTGISSTLDLAPDLLIAEADDEERTSWNVLEEGQPPHFVLEVVTKESWPRDVEVKPLLYDALGVREYAICAPKRVDGGPVLFGYHRSASGRFERWDAGADGVLWSQALGGLGLYVEQGKWLRVRDQAGHRLPCPQEEAARAQQEAARA